MTIEVLKKWGAFKWQQRNRTIVTLASMDCGHIRNCIAMFERSISKLESEAASGFGYAGSGDMAQYYAEIAGDRALGKLREVEELLEFFRNYLKLREQFNFIQEGPQ